MLEQFANRVHIGCGECDSNIENVWQVFNAFVNVENRIVSVRLDYELLGNWYQAEFGRL
jgi:hypothetical protein